MSKATNNRPIAIDLFSGAGGLGLGFEQAGFDVPLAVDVDPVHAAVHQFNFPLCEVLPRSVTTVTGQEIRARAGLATRDAVAVLLGGAPCQGFSIIGQRSSSDPRNVLVRDFLRLVDELQPDYFVFENVKGLTFGKQRRVLDEILIDIAATGYQLVKPWQVLNAADYGVPQNRERLFLIGARKDLPVPTYPLPSKKSPTCQDALEDLPDAEQFESLLEKSEVIASLSDDCSEYAKRLRCEPDCSTGWHFGYRRQWNRALLTNSVRTKHSERSRTRFANTPPGTREPISHFDRLPPNGVSTTLRAGTDSARGSFTSPRPIHYRYARCITVREMARLHGFPDWFRLHSTKWHGARQVGNSVPPPLGRAIAAEILKTMGHQPSRPEGSLKTGNERLLTMTASEAAQYWGIESPIRQRDTPRRRLSLAS